MYTFRSFSVDHSDGKVMGEIYRLKYIAVSIKRYGLDLDKSRLKPTRHRVECGGKI